MGKKHQHNVAQALFAGFRPRYISLYILALSLFSNVADIAAPWCLVVRLISGCSVVHRRRTLSSYTHVPQGTSVRLHINSFKCLTHAVLQGLDLRRATSGELATWTGHSHCEQLLC